MNKDLIYFIELCLADGIISDKERMVILKKGEELGVSKEECEILIDSLSQKHQQLNSISSKPTKVEKREFTRKTVKKIPPAKLNREKFFMDKIYDIEKTIKKIEKDKIQVISELRNSSKIINQKKNNLKLKSIIRDYEKEYSSLINLFIKKIEDDISAKFVKTKIIIENHKKANVDLDNLSKIIDKDTKWDNSNLNRKYDLRRILFNLLGIFSIVPALTSVSLKKHISPIFVITMGIIFLCTAAYYGNKKSQNVMNFTDEDVKTITQKNTEFFKPKIDKLKERKKIVNRIQIILDHIQTLEQN